MRNVRWVWLGVLLSANVAWAGAPTCNNNYNEVGDAGNRFAPQDVTGGPYCGFSGHIGDALIGETVSLQLILKDTEDAFRFHVDAGKYNVNLDPFGGNTTQIALALYFDADRNNPIPETSSHVWDVTAGNYVLELTYTGSDPPFTAAVFNLDPNPNILPIAAPQQEVPAPGALALLLAGLAGLGALRRRA